MRGAPARPAPPGGGPAGSGSRPDARRAAGSPVMRCRQTVGHRGVRPAGTSGAAGSTESPGQPGPAGECTSAGRPDRPRWALHPAGAAGPGRLPGRAVWAAGSGRLARGHGPRPGLAGVYRRRAGHRRPGAGADIGLNPNPTVGRDPGRRVEPPVRDRPAERTGHRRHGRQAEDSRAGWQTPQMVGGHLGPGEASAAGPVAGARATPGQGDYGWSGPGSHRVRADVPRAGPGGPWRRSGFRCGPWT